MYKSILRQNRKSCVIIIVFIFVTSTIYAIDGNWIFENYYIQNIIGGKATVQSLQVNIINKITFYNSIINSALGSKKAIVELISDDSKYVKYNAEYKDTASLIMLWVKRGNEEIDLWIFVSKLDDGAYWYSYAISNDTIKTKRVNGTTKNDQEFSNMLGIMKKE